MKRIVTALCLCGAVLPAQAQAGFMWGYAAGQSANRCEETTPVGIPPACFFAPDVESYGGCRRVSAMGVYGAVYLATAMTAEWRNIVQPWQEFNAAKEQRRQ